MHFCRPRAKVTRRSEQHKGEEERKQAILCHHNRLIMGSLLSTLLLHMRNLQTEAVCCPILILNIVPNPARHLKPPPPESHKITLLADSPRFLYHFPHSLPDLFLCCNSVRYRKQYLPYGMILWWVGVGTVAIAVANTTVPAVDYQVTAPLSSNVPGDLNSFLLSLVNRRNFIASLFLKPPTRYRAVLRAGSCS